LTSAELAILVLVGAGVIASLVLYILWPAKPPLPPEEALNESIVAQQWASGLDLPTHHVGIEGGG
jgi:hypothetical protein